MINKYNIIKMIWLTRFQFLIFQLFWKHYFWQQYVFKKLMWTLKDFHKNSSWNSVNILDKSFITTLNLFSKKLTKKNLNFFLKYTKFIF